MSMTPDISEQPSQIAIVDGEHEIVNQFLADASEINLSEIAIGKLAEHKTMIPIVKDLGKMIEKAHIHAQENLLKLSNERAFILPSKLSGKRIEFIKLLIAKEGREFDLAFSIAVVEEHKKAIARYERAGIELKDENLKAWIYDILPELRVHLDNAITCQKHFGK